ncbi:hypothetical protein OG369_41390 [Streptomyces sp. NBC_01221]|uniref:hypothetical protein n=1 Tax=Streptomyces sp. NBC_01221 TaxID=2903782 RepID=UPI0022575064|nr:hypothetical protein [Streptomyces sp. NBC_01221]MCX4792258.1 hypothetical protein [Streptomyces sp. NBC_01221]
MGDRPSRRATSAPESFCRPVSRIAEELARCTIDRTSDTTGRATEKIRYLLSTWNP